MAMPLNLRILGKASGLGNSYGERTELFLVAAAMKAVARPLVGDEED
jgi:hypothetical protein